MKKQQKRHPTKSLRTLLIIWLLAFSIVPLAFVTGYSLANYNKAIDQELHRRLLGNERELQVIIAEFQKELELKNKSHSNDKTLAYYLSSANMSAARELATKWMRTSIVQRLSVFSREGRLEVALYRDSEGETQRQSQLEGKDVYLSERFINESAQKGQQALIDFVKDSSLELIMFSEIKSSSGSRVGFIEEIFKIDKYFIQNLKSRLGLELIFLSKEGDKFVSSHEDLSNYRHNFFIDKYKETKGNLFELNLRGVPFGFVVQPLSWGEQNFYVALGVSKKAIQDVLKNVNYAFFTMVIAVVLLLIVLSFVISKILLQPLNQLVDLVQDVDFEDRPKELTIRSDNELGILAQAFNEMTGRVYNSQKELKENIKKLEEANNEIRQTQARLVHSAKMVSLGQLVAGVAHELNNPISFIYSNMEHLKDYSTKLVQLVEAAETDPLHLAQHKEKLEFDYIVQDMPKLIKSCEEGARRTRDIVIGLRNFSRLDEAKVKEVDVHEGIDSTLELLAGEFKTRIKVTKNYAKLPKIMCYPSQLNQVFMNILSNAAHAIKDNGEIHISTKANDKDHIQVSIRDNGEGMSEEVRERLFDPFFTTKDVSHGTGLGMSITYGIVQKHNGDIEVQSKPGKGTEFIITLPISLEA